MKYTQIIILAAGKGTRMGGDIPKALTPLGSQTMLEHVVETIESIPSYTKKPIVVVGYKADLIKDVLGDRVHYAFQKEQKGTGHAVLSAQDLIDGDTQRVLILYADQPFVSRETMGKLVIQKQSSKNPLSLATAYIENDDLFMNQFYNFGRIIRDDQDNIQSIVEVKDAQESQKEIREVNPAYFCCDTAWMFESLFGLKNDNAQGEYYLTDLVKIAFSYPNPIESIQINEKEALGANTPEQLAVLDSYLK